MQHIPPRIVTLTAFLIGYALIDDTNSQEQNYLGGFFMLIGQTLSTNASSQFKHEWNNATRFSNSNQTTSKENMVDLLKKSRDAIDEQIKRMTDN